MRVKYKLVRACDKGFAQLVTIDSNRQLSLIVRNLATDQHRSNWGNMMVMLIMIIEYGYYCDAYSY
jgi:hypothetical protein